MSAPEPRSPYADGHKGLDSVWHRGRTARLQGFTRDSCPYGVLPELGDDPISSGRYGGRSIWRRTWLAGWDSVEE